MTNTRLFNPKQLTTKQGLAPGGRIPEGEEILERGSEEVDDEDVVVPRGAFLENRQVKPSGSRRGETAGAPFSPLGCTTARHPSHRAPNRVHGASEFWGRNPLGRFATPHHTPTPTFGGTIKAARWTSHGLLTRGLGVKKGVNRWGSLNPPPRPLGCTTALYPTVPTTTPGVSQLYRRDPPRAVSPRCSTPPPPPQSG